MVSLRCVLLLKVGCDGGHSSVQRVQGRGQAGLRARAEVRLGQCRVVRQLRTASDYLAYGGLNPQRVNEAHSPANIVDGDCIERRNRVLAISFKAMFPFPPKFSQGRVHSEFDEVSYLLNKKSDQWHIAVMPQFTFVLNLVDCRLVCARGLSFAQTKRAVDCCYRADSLNPCRQVSAVFWGEGLPFWRENDCHCPDRCEDACNRKENCDGSVLDDCSGFHSFSSVDARHISAARGPV